MFASTQPPAAGVVIWGASGHALVVADVIRSTGGRVIGFLDDVDPSRHDAPFGGARILGGQEMLPRLLESGVRFLIVAIGDCLGRLACAKKAAAEGFKFPVLVHPAATVASTATIGSGSFIAAGAVVGPGARVGQHAILNTGCAVDHECEIGEGTHLGPGSRLGGRVRVGRACWLAIGSVVVDRVTIGDASVIGAAALVLRDIPSGVVAYGLPARVVRQLS